MKVLLVKEVPNLGKTGDIKEVANGYARNYLIPKGLVTPATGAALNQAQQQKAAEQRRQAKIASTAQALAEKLGQTEIHFKAKVGGQHRLYGSITSSDIAEELKRQIGETVDKRDVDLDEPLRHLGSFKVPIRLGPGLIPTISVVVEPEE